MFDDVQSWMASNKSTDLVETGKTYSSISYLRVTWKLLKKSFSSRFLSPLFPTP